MSIEGMHKELALSSAIPYLTDKQPGNRLREQMSNLLSAEGYEGNWRVLFAIPIDQQAFFSDPACQPGEVAVARHNTEALESLGMQEIHCVDDKGAIARVFMNSISELFNRLDGIGEQRFPPRCKVCGGKVVIDPLNGS